MSDQAAKDSITDLKESGDSPQDDPKTVSDDPEDSKDSDDDPNDPEKFSGSDSSDSDDDDCSEMMIRQMLQMRLNQGMTVKREKPKASLFDLFNWPSNSFKPAVPNLEYIKIETGISPKRFLKKI